VGNGSTNLYAYSLSSIKTGQGVGTAVYNNVLYIGALTGNAYFIGNTDVKQAYLDGVSSGYVDLYYF
jgi:hypothetical protein